MNAISSFAPGRFLRVEAAPANLSGLARRSGPPAQADDGATRVTFGASAGVAAVYSDPRSKSGFTHLWSSPPSTDDGISGLMARNRALNSYHLRDQWRGLGGALLTRFAKTGEDYTQTLIDDRWGSLADGVDGMTPEAQAVRAAAVRTKQAADLANVTVYAATTDMKVLTRSGQSVELKIAVNPGSGGIVGMKVELKASGALSSEERAAVEQLASGLDRALEALGRADAVDLDLAGLMSYDRTAIASVDLRAANQSHSPLGTFSLHLGDDTRSVALKGSDGELRLNVAGQTPSGSGPALERRAAVQRTLDRMDSAGKRGRANAALVDQMKSAFTVFQAAAKDGGDGPAVDAGTGPRLSGLADFDASFGGPTIRYNRFGTMHEAGRLQYRLSQATTSADDASGRRSTAQTVSEQLSADYRRATAPDGMLDVRNGEFTTTHVQDSSTVTTLVESTGGRVTRALRKTDEAGLQ